MGEAGVGPARGAAEQGCSCKHFFVSQSVVSVPALK